MIKNLRHNIVAVLLLLSPIAFSQVTVTFPSERAVFQRNKKDTAYVYIAGFVTQSFSRIEARFVPRVAGEGQKSPLNDAWKVIGKNIQNGQFYDSIPVKGGWYTLQVRGIAPGQTPVETQVQRVGVGEVFVVAGQSNATGGDQNPNGPGAVYDQVNSVDFQNVDGGVIKPYNQIQLPCPTFVHLDAAVKTSPFGNYAWCWGSFGDQLYQKLKVPVMIFNAGWSSTSVTDWKTSIDPNTSPTSVFGYQFPAGLPFGHLRQAMNYYAAQLGVRAVLWHQGESDNLANTSQSDYVSRLWDVISASRNLSGKNNLAWVVARASRYTINNATTTSLNVINAQNEIVNNNAAYPHVYQGPDTDPYYDLNYRHDQVHFSGAGLVSLAQFWVEKITDDFIAQSVPYTAIAPPMVSAVYNASTSQTTLTGPALVGGGKYNWLNTDNCYASVSSSQSYAVSSGSYKLKITDSHQNVLYSPMLSIPSAPLPVVWKNFTAKINERGRAALEWSTASEIKNARFDVQRSTDALTFTNIKSIDGAGNSRIENQYQYEDEFLPAGLYYYRLRQVDFDGSGELSRIVRVKIEHQKTISVFPNPVSDKLTITSDEPVGLVSVWDQTGRKIFDVTGTANEMTVDMSNLPRGLYVIQAGEERVKVAVGF